MIDLSPAQGAKIRDLLKGHGGLRSSSGWGAIEEVAGIPPGALIEVTVHQDTGEVFVWARTPGDLLGRN